MNYTTLENLEQTTERKRLREKVLHFLNEIKLIAFMFIFVSLWMIVFTNAKLFISDVQDSIAPTTLPQNPLNTNDIYQDNSIASVIENSDQKNKEIQQMIDSYKQNWNQQLSMAAPIEKILEDNLQTYNFKFNTLPPTNRLIVPSLGVDDPIVISKYMELRDFTNWNFDEELKDWVVKYPTTPNPWEWWNTLIFGHTSQERWKYNHYGMTFAHITELDQWDIIQVTRNGVLYEYEVIDVQVVYPQHVDEEYQKYNWLGKSYLTLMWCYPIGKATQRILVIAEEIEK